jgi:hypothetical protein
VMPMPKSSRNDRPRKPQANLPLLARGRLTGREGARETPTLV